MIAWASRLLTLIPAGIGFVLLMYGLSKMDISKTIILLGVFGVVCMAFLILTGLPIGIVMIVTGFAGGDNGQTFAKQSDPPDIGAVCQYLGMGPKDLPGAVCMPCYPGQGEGIRRPGPYGGYLGSQYDPLFTVCKPTFERQPKVPYYDPVPPIGDPQMPSLEALPEMTAVRLDGRRRRAEHGGDQDDEEPRRAHETERTRACVAGENREYGAEKARWTPTTRHPARRRPCQRAERSRSCSCGSERPRSGARRQGQRRRARP